MNITFEKLRAIKHALPTGSIRKIANALDLPQQTVRDYFGATVSAAKSSHYQTNSVRTGT